MLKESKSIFDAVAHPVRRTLLDALRAAGEPLTITELGLRCEISRSTASRHLDILRSTGFVTARRARTSTLNELDHRPFSLLDRWLWRFLADPSD